MRKTNLALLVAVLVSSPLALADDYGTQGGYDGYQGGGGYDGGPVAGDDVTNNTDVGNKILTVDNSGNKHKHVTYTSTYDKDLKVTDSFNTDYNYDVDKSWDKSYSVNDSYNQDNDALLMHNLNNDRSHRYTDNSDNSKHWEDNSTHDYSQDWHIDMDTNHFVSKAELDGSVAQSSVKYGGGCCDSGYGDSRGRYGSGGGAGMSEVMVTQSNEMNNSFAGASGINMAGQNAGNNSLVQQSASTNAILY
ncbi:hypothetical protein A3K86_15385 [Photobacterium jeanii]|uniref:Uncharacterized protein n=1 Tax=Photobacterium jeanii TaxID=858640 RepID=A0A178K7D6_9GAMM|nr:hypothetical protein [Photobacterium jeanii]OAN13047.1 hypothetical protein A3K86_15385 [Photobacterium jeanii]PST89195.1 hypothetical protein C9I91_13830 [Photobacterium jeanii]